MQKAIIIHLSIIIIAIFAVTAQANERLLIAEDGNPSDNFGYATAVSGDYAIIGARNDSDIASNAGSAYIFKNNGSTWSQYQKLTSGSDTTNQYFGDAVDICGKYAVVGAYGDNSNKGAAYVFELVGDEWQHIKTLSAPDGSSNHRFGHSVAISNQFVLVGAQRYTNSSGYYEGRAYTFKNTDWTCKTLTFSRNDHQYFGSSVAISANYAIVGAPNYSSHYGYIKIYKLNNGVWSNVKDITGQSQEYLGNTVDITDQHAIIGASNYNNQQGKAYIYPLESWTKIQLRPNDPANSDYFAQSVAINDNYAIVGAYYDDDNGVNSGSAYVFKNSNGTWTEISKIIASDGYQYDYYGYAVSMSANEIFVGAYNKSSAVGSVYNYSLDNISDNQRTISGYVYDKNLTPIPLALLTFQNIGSVVTNLEGFFSNSVYKQWSGKLSVHKNDYVFTPAERYFDKIVQNYENQNFYRQVFTISGMIKDPDDNPLGGITINFNNDGGTTSTNSQGFYSHEVYHNWAGIAVPEKKGYKFTPLNIPFNNVQENLSDQHFIAQRYTISGFIYDDEGNPMENVHLIFSNNGGETQTNAQGFFTHDIDYQWSGTLTPKKSGYDFTPQYLTYSNIIGNHLDQKIAANERTYDILGQIKDQDGDPLQGVSLCFGSKTNCVESDIHGNYRQAVPFQWKGVVTPTIKGYYFIPASLPYDSVLADQEAQNYSAVIHTYLVSGIIKENGQPLGNVTVHCNDTDVITDATGRFTFETYYGWSGTISPEKEGYNFDPPDYSYISGIDTNMSQADFNAEKQIFTISGTIIDPDNVPVSEVSIKFPGIGIVYTNHTGSYQCDVPYGWSGTTELFKSNYVFAPKHEPYVYVKENKTKNYSAVFSASAALMAKVNERKVSHESGQVAFEILSSPSNLTWEFNEPAYSWIHLEKEGDNLIVSFDENSEELERTATLTVQATDAVNSPQILTLIQEAKPEEVIGPDWKETFDHTQYQYFETVTAIVSDDTGGLFDDHNDILAAFFEDECRGIAQIIETSTGKRYFLQIWSNNYKGEVITFKFYDADKDRINVNIKYPIEFESGKSLGSIDFPHEFEITDFYIRLALNKHWNWISVNVLNEDMSINSVLSSVQDKGIIVIGQEGYAQYMALHDHWDGSLKNINAAHMYMLKTNDPSNLEFSGNALDVSQMPMNLSTGWNWLGYLPNENMSIDHALASLDGNAKQICGQKGFAVYLENEGWFGSLELLEANHGYQIFMTTEDILTYPVTSEPRKARTRSLRKAMQRNSINGWSFDASQFQHQCTLTASVILDNQALGSAGDALVAFVDGVCRGIAYPSETPVGTRFFLQIWGSENETAILKYYQADQNKVHDITTRVEIIPNQIYGDIYQVHELYIGIQNHAPQWTVNSEQFQYRASVVASMDIQGLTITSENDVLAVFADGECRGVATPKETPEGTRFFIQVWSNESSEEMTYKYYKASEDTVYDIQDSLTFSVNASMGSLESPQVLTINSSNETIEKLESTIITQRATIDDLTDNINRKESRITSLEQSISQLNTQVNQLNSDIASKSEEIQTLSDNIAATIEKYGRYTTHLQPGWYLIGGINATITPKTIPENAIEQMYAYKNYAYEPVTQFTPGGGYWIKIRTACELILEDLP